MEGTRSSNRSKRASRVGAASEDLEQRVARTSALDAGPLQNKWEALFGAESSQNLGRSFMVRALSYRIQEKALGALKPSALRILDRVADARSSVESSRSPKRRANAGTILIREWRGVSHRVTVLDHDVVYDGRRYKSLSEVARLITGTHWSGPMFFGLRNRKKEAANG